jgi:signal transduction histidine kinase
VGAEDPVLVRRIAAELRNRFAASAHALASTASTVIASHELIRAASEETSDTGRLFELLQTSVSVQSDSTLGITVHDSSGNPIAWAGRVSDLPSERVDGPAALFIAPGALGPRLVRVDPVPDPNRPTARLGTVVVEHLVGDVRVSSDFSDTFELATSLTPVSLRARLGDSGSQSAYSFVIPSGEGQLLVEAHVDPANLQATRQRWRSAVRGAVMTVLGLTTLFLAVPLGEIRRRARASTVVLSLTALSIGAVGAATFLMGWAARLLPGTQSSIATIDLLLVAGFAGSLVWLVLDVVVRWRLTRPRLQTSAGSAAAALCGYLAAGVIDLSVLWIYSRALAQTVLVADTSLLSVSIHPLSLPRLGLGFGLIVMHAAVVWGAALAPHWVAVAFRRPRSFAFSVLAFMAWASGVWLATLIALQVSNPVPLGPLVVALAAVGACAVALSRPGGRARRASQAARLGALFLALVLPVLSMHPTLHAHAIGARERLIAEEFGPQALHLRDNLQESLRQALETIDGLPSLGAFIPDPPLDSTPTTDQAFQLWSTTDLARLRLTSAVELYSVDGELASRFALNLPEYAPTNHVAPTCEWDLLEEVSSIGSSERHVLRASRGVCAEGRRMGTVVVRAMLDYRTLPFISSESPYVESLRADEGLSEAASSRDIEFAMYGWSRAPIEVTGTSVWPMPNAVFQRMVASREPIWETVERDNRDFRVHFLNDRGGIYALGYPVVTPFGHLVNFAELVTLCGLVYVLLIGGATVAGTLTSRAHLGGRALLREVRSSFYRKLFLAFVAAAVVPVVVLAVATRTYFAAQFRAGIEESAVQTAAVAQRLVEDYATLQEPGGALGRLDDQVMVLIGRAIDQAVNLFDREHLQATSERDLFASGLLSSRTPANVYRAIVLDRMPTFVGEEEAGGFSYLLAAAPARSGGREGIVTVPQTLRTREINEQINELDRRVLFASVLFVLLGAAIGYWMAERIADPVNRLSRATRRIALGDLNARIAATSSDELRRLVEDFNQMAADLQRQRTELERSQRLEAWAEMARQVAHDIKNPLTPIQLSAEHARRINLDKGQPLSPVLDDCINAILTQVTLLRQISAEFSSFASSPTPRFEPTDVAALVDEVVAPYRTALAGRVSLVVESEPRLPRVALDRTLFARALTNVIENALHAMPGGGHLAVRSYASALDRTGEGRDGAPVEGTRPGVVVQITDTGVGMDPESVARIFEPYFSTKASGTGLGLTIAKRNIELNGGAIAVESLRGTGTTVTITFPS